MLSLYSIWTNDSFWRIKRPLFYSSFIAAMETQAIVKSKVVFVLPLKWRKAVHVMSSVTG